MTENSNPALPKRYHPVVVTLHWLVAILIFATALLANEGEGGRERFRPGSQLGTGGGSLQPGNLTPPAFSAEGGEGGPSRQAGVFSSIGIHMILGTSIILLLLMRLIARWRTQHPEWATTGNALLDRLGGLTHFGLYLLGFLMPITGIILAWQRNELARVFGIGVVVAGNSFRRGGFSLGMFHGLVWTLLLLLIALHVAASMYHQFYKKDNLLSRMWYGA